MTVRRSAIKSKRSKKRQGRRLRTTVIFIIIVVAFIVGGISWLAHNENVSINDIQIEGARSVDTEEIKKIVEENISGYHLWVFPKKNTLIFSKNKLRVEILDEYKQIKNVVIKRNGFKAITITIFEREPFALWCDGETPLSGENVDAGNCYFVDCEGYIFASAPYFHDHVYFELYGKPFEVVEVKKETTEKEKPASAKGYGEAKEELNAKITGEIEYIGKHFLPPVEFVRTMQFISSLEKIEILVYSLIIDSPDMYKLTLKEGGVLRFLPEQDHYRAINDLTIAYKKKFSESFDLLPKDLEYIDIRFDNKALFKFKD